MTSALIDRWSGQKVMDQAGRAYHFMLLGGREPALVFRQWKTGKRRLTPEPRRLGILRLARSLSRNGIRTYRQSCEVHFNKSSRSPGRRGLTLVPQDCLDNSRIALRLPSCSFCAAWGRRCGRQACGIHGQIGHRCHLAPLQVFKVGERGALL